MDTGPVIALASALCFGLGNAVLRRGTFGTGESYTATLTSVLVGICIVPIVITLTGTWDTFLTLSLRNFGLLATAGIAHFVCGRFLFYTALRLLGANRAGALIQTNVLFAVLLGIVLLDEVFTIRLAFGVLCILTGVTLVSIRQGGKQSSGWVKGIMAVLGGALFWGITPILIKPTMETAGIAPVATFVSYLAAMVVLLLFMIGKRPRQQLTASSYRTLFLLAVSGIFMSVAQLLRYLALNYSPVSQITPIISTASLFTLLVSVLVNREIEVFTWNVIVGICVTVFGVFLLFLLF